MDVNNVLGIATIAISLVQMVSEIKGVKAKMDALETNMGMVPATKADIGFQLEQEERKPGKKRKKEVELWMQTVGSLEEQVHHLGRKVKKGHFFSHLMLKDQVSGLATEVEKLHDKGRFDNGLTLNVKPATGYELQLRQPVRPASFHKSLRMLNRLSFKPPSRFSSTLMELRQLRRIRWPGCGRLDGAHFNTVLQEGIVRSRIPLAGLEVQMPLPSSLRHVRISSILLLLSWVM